MDIFDRNPVLGLDEFVFENADVQNQVSLLLYPQNAVRTLFVGSAGTGKSSLCQIIARELVGDGYWPDVKAINVSHHTNKNSLSSEIEGFRGCGVLKEPLKNLGMLA